MSPTIAWAPTIRPPLPRPWIARNAISSTMEWLSPDSTEPTRKITIEAWKKIFRPYWSPSLPHNGVEPVVASRWAVITQAMCEPPFRSPTIVGSAVETIVWSSAASDIPSIRAPRMSRIARRDKSGRAPLPVTAAPSPACSGEGPPAEELDMLICGRPFGFAVLSISLWCAARRGPGRLGQVAQRAVFREPVRERQERGVGQLIEGHGTAGRRPERHGRPEHAGGRAGQQQGVRVAVRIGAEPFGQGAGEAGFHLGHVRGLRRPQLRIAVRGLHLSGPVSWVAAELRQFGGQLAGPFGQDHAQHLQGAVTRQVDRKSVV